MRLILVLLAIPMGAAEVPFGAKATLRASANADAKPSPTYECFKDGVKVGSAVNYSIPSATVADAGTYVFRASNGIGPGAVSTPIEVVIATAPIISGAFPNVEITKGKSHTLAVTAYGQNLVYKWKKGGKIIKEICTSRTYQLSVEIIAGQTLPTYTISSAKPPDAGTYACEVSNTAGQVEATCKVTVANK